MLKKADGKGTPYLEKSAKGARVDNFVVYLNDDSLEKYYSSVDSYNNSASGFISFSDLKTDYNFKVIGAFIPIPRQATITATCSLIMLRSKWSRQAHLSFILCFIIAFCIIPALRR